MSQDDRRLLEMAAKAAGVERGADRLDSGLSLTEPDGRHRSLPRWNPLTHDEDALRLAVRLELAVITAGPYSESYLMNSPEGNRVEKHGDPYAATRRAIVRAAAAIGEQMP